MRKDVHHCGLDFLRFVAAWLVVLDHFGLYGWAHVTASATGEALAFPALHDLENVGSIGVEIFFLISGFVIAASAKGTTASRFILNRAIRVFPALWLCGLIALVARATAGEPLNQLANYYLRSAVLSPAGPYIDGVVWTLVIEAVFYILIFVLLARHAFDKLDAVAKILGVLSAAFVSVMAVACILAHTNAHIATLAALCDRFPSKVLLLRHGVFFALGMLLWSGFETRFDRARLQWMAVLAIFCSVEIGINRGSPHEFALPIAIWWAGLAAIVLSVAYSREIYERLRPWTGIVQDMGRVSYPLYLNHYVLGMVLVPALFASGLSWAPVLVVSLGIVSVSSYLIMRYPERLIQKALRKGLKRKLKPAAVATAVGMPVRGVHA